MNRSRIDILDAGGGDLAVWIEEEHGSLCVGSGPSLIDALIASEKSLRTYLEDVQERLHVERISEKHIGAPK